MKDETFSKCIEPFWHLLSIASGSLVAINALRYQIIHPSPVQHTWCTRAQYPWWCDEDEHHCFKSENLFGFNGFFVSLIVIISIIVISLGMIVWHAYFQERLFKSYRDASNANTGASPVDQQRLQIYQIDVNNTRLIVYQAILYTVAFLAVWHHPLMVRPYMERNGIYKSSPAAEIARLVLRPLQGFFNVFIFLYHKVENYQRDDPSLSLRGALKQVFDREKDDPDHLVSNLVLVRRDSHLGRLQFAFEVEPETSCRDSDDKTPIEVNRRAVIPAPAYLTPVPSVAHSAQDLEGFVGFGGSPGEVINDNDGLSDGDTSHKSGYILSHDLSRT